MTKYSPTTEATPGTIFFLLGPPHVDAYYYSQEKIALFLRFFKVPGNRAHILLGRPLNLFLLFKKKAHVISRGEGKNTVAIALGQADPLV